MRRGDVHFPNNPKDLKAADVKLIGQLFKEKYPKRHNKICDVFRRSSIFGYHNCNKMHDNAEKLIAINPNTFTWYLGWVALMDSWRNTVNAVLQAEDPSILIAGIEKCVSTAFPHFILDRSHKDLTYNLFMAELNRQAIEEEPAMAMKTSFR